MSDACVCELEAELLRTQLGLNCMLKGCAKHAPPVLRRPRGLMSATRRGQGHGEGGRKFHRIIE